MAGTKKRPLREAVRARAGQPDRVRTMTRLAAEGVPFGKVEGSEIRADVFSGAMSTEQAREIPQPHNSPEMSKFPPQGPKGLMKGVGGRGRRE